RGLHGTLSHSNGVIEVEVGGSHARDKPRSAGEGHVLNCPLNENQDATLELNDVSEVNKGPNHPRWPSPKMHTENVGHRGRPPDDCKVSFVEVAKWRRPRFTSYLPPNRFRRVGPSLHGYLGDPLQRVAMFFDR